MLVGIPRKHELRMTSAWLRLEPIYTQMTNEFVTSVRSSGTQRFSESRERPESQARRGPALDLAPLCPVSAPLPCAYTRTSISVGCVPRSPTPAQPRPSGLRALGSCVIEQFQKDEACPAAAAGAQRAFSRDTRVSSCST